MFLLWVGHGESESENKYKMDFCGKASLSPESIRRVTIIAAEGSSPERRKVMTGCIMIIFFRCVTKLCDPKMTVELEIPDLMICAVHAPTAFTCLANGIDHTPCCRQRGIPSPCTDLCAANFTTRLDFHYFK